MDMSRADMIHDMQMAFGFGIDAGTVLFKDFNVKDGGQFFCALLLILAMALVTEGLSFSIWYQKFAKDKSAESGLQIGQKVVGSLFYFVLRLFNYCQMLIAMTFNFWLILAIAICQFMAWYVFQEIKDGMMIKKI